MSKVVKLPTGSATGSSPSLAKTLSDAIATPTTVLEDGTARPSTWTPPTVIPPELRREAADALPGLLAWMQPADDAGVRQWLGDLGVLVAGNLGADEARAKLVAFTSLLTDDYPRAAFTKRTLAAAARRFKFFPAFAELCDFLDDTKAELRTKVDRVQALAKPAPRRREPPPEPVSIEQRHRNADRFRLIATAMETGDWSACHAECDRINGTVGGMEE